MSFISGVFVCLVLMSSLVDSTIFPEAVNTSDSIYILLYAATFIVEHVLSIHLAEVLKSCLK